MIPRDLLPQIPKEKYGEFVKFLKQNGVIVKAASVPSDRLKPIQAHVNRGKVNHFKQDDTARKIPIICSKGGLILDGHHRWLANKELGIPTICIIADCGIRRLVELGHEFDGSFTKSVYECTIYGQRVFDETCDDNEESISLMVRRPLTPKMG